MSNKLSSSVPTDREVVLGILNNSEDALNKLYTGHFPMVLQFILNNNGDEDDAKDVYQETIIIVYNKIKSGDFELTSKLKTYIYSISRRIWLKKLSQQNKKTSNNLSEFEDVVAVEVDVEQHEEKDLQFEKMKTAMLSLGEPCKTIIQDFYMHNLSMQDISEKFGYTNTDNAKTQKYKCLQRLKKLFFQN
ncbi:MAG: sigma-70 family RNA polymerase sigma factor [Pedobacter sp.]|nr:MAG: sigma-70 family RNA polymerase sigma factor [Pedobacter sp.]